MANTPKRAVRRPWMAKREIFEGRVQSPFYWSTLWRRKRASYVRRFPLCVHCQNEGWVTPTQEVDHIKPINPIDVWDFQDGKYGHPLDDNNLQPLCKSHHARKTGLTKGREIR